ncbi:protein patched homolog 1-like isoform X1 [Haliotis rufescens]|uniref:protein patched homolog 1-like isoform X1 n=1 Tax=Haliotis rufescens TaxID=6454 RepID=UPI00201FB308|nr:protein patched homolog 1-like isoform X1 [Haliotis rufescens]
MNSGSREQLSRSKTPKKHGILKRISNAIIETLEKGFYKLGLNIGKRPWIVMLCCTIACGLVGIGFLRFNETTDPDKLWIPIGADIINQRKWATAQFPSTLRVATIIVTGSNLLTKTSLQAVYSMYEAALNATSANGFKLADVCLKIGPNCRVSSLLDLWSFDKATIDGLSQQDILDAVNTIKVSPVFGNSLDVTTLLGVRTENGSGHITGAQALTSTWFLLGDDNIKENTMDWELQLIEIGKNGHAGLSESFVFTARSFSDEGGSAIQGDATLLSAGYIILIIFVIAVLGRFNMVEQRIGLALAGILCVGLSILVSFGMASMVGAEYGPLHSILPFLLLGIGVDDMFVIIGALNNLTPDEREMEIPEKVGRILRHAGVSVTVTSLTDIVAFAIGASTILPALRSFCIFAAFGILGLYIMQTVFFTACLAVDLQRVSGMRDACCCCYKHKNWQPNKCSQTELIPLFFKKVQGPFLSKLPVKIIVLILTLGIFAANVYGLINLKQDFDSSWFLPSDGYAFKFFEAQDKYFPDDGADGYIYCSNLNYYDNRAKLSQLYDSVSAHPYTYNGTVDSWYEAYRVATGVGVVTDEASFIQSVFDWAHLPANSRVLRDIKFTNASGTATDIVATRMAFQHVGFPDSQSEVKAMDTIREVISSILPSCFPYSRRYQGWETNKVIQLELYRNLGLAFACVFVVTLILIANFLTSVLVFTCVTFTLVNVGGCMYFWGLTIDTVTSIILILAIGLAVDYSAHIGHQFMTIRGNRQERMLETLAEMGPPVFNGGFSTFLAFILLVGSNSYVFTTFFKVFLLVVCFGLFHGLIYLPVILSWIGPSPYLSADHDYHSNGTEVDPAVKSGYANGGAATIGSPPPEPLPDYDKPAMNGFSRRMTPNGTSLYTTTPPIPPPDYTPPMSTRKSIPRVST